MRDESLFFLFSPVTRIKGVGSAAAKSLANLLPPATAAGGGGLPIVRDLLFHLPVGLIDRSFTCPLREAPEGKVCTFVVRVDEHVPPPQRGRSKRPYRVVCSNETGEITLIFFHASEEYLSQTLPVGSRRAISGRVERFDYMLQMPHPDIIAPAASVKDVMRPDPVYPLTAGLTSRRIGKLVEETLEKLPVFPEWQAALQPDAGCQMPDVKKKSSSTSDLRHPASDPQHLWSSWKIALWQAHHPASEADLSPESPARERLAYDEMLALQLHLALVRRKTQQQPGIKISGTGAWTEPLIASLPYQLTAGQKKVLEEIASDMASGGRMVRLLQGDVGSGKTIVALLAMLRAAEEGHQAALMAPTELIAQQHYELLTQQMSDVERQMSKDSSLISDIRHPTSGAMRLLTGSVKGAAREQALAAIESGAASIVIGTHALFQEHVAFKNLALVAIDEQQRFGVAQRMALAAKGDSPHILQLTATPIPRSLSMIVYGDMDVSLLTEKPAGRQAITTRLIPLSRYGEIMDRLQAALDRGEKAYWICPLIEEVDSYQFTVDSQKTTDSLSTDNCQLSTDLAAAKSRFAEFTARFGARVGLVHGRMKSAERDEQMRRFASGEVSLLVATTIVEVGVDVPDATIMVIEHAERFGLSQLHQLRGRVGRGEKPSACVLLYSEAMQQDAGNQMSDVKNVSLTSDLRHLASTEALTRLSVLRDTDDGFKIAEADLAQRGGGDLLGVRQSGLPRFIFTDLLRHQPLLAKARDEAREILKTDPGLSSPRGQALKILLQLFGHE